MKKHGRRVFGSLRTPASKSGTSTKQRKPSGEPLRLDLGCGQRKKDGFTGVDVAACTGVDVVHDLNVLPWPFKDNTVDEVFSSHVVEHVANLMDFMNEIGRILKPGGLVEIHHPYCMNKRAFQDPTHVRFIPEETWVYFDLAWRKANGLDHYPITCDLEVVVISGEGIDPGIMQRNADTVTFAQRHYWNVIADLMVKMKKREPKA